MANCGVLSSPCPIARQQADASTSGRSSTAHCMHGLYSGPTRTPCHKLRSQTKTRQSYKHAFQSKPQVACTAATSLGSSSEVCPLQPAQLRIRPPCLTPCLIDRRSGMMGRTTMWWSWEQGTPAVKQPLLQPDLAAELCC